MKKVLFVASVTRHINTFHIPYLKYFKDNGYEVHVASNGEENIKYCDKHFNIPFERSPIKKNNLKAYKQLKELIKNEEYTAPGFSFPQICGWFWHFCVYPSGHDDLSHVQPRKPSGNDWRWHLRISRYLRFPV